MEAKDLRPVTPIKRLSAKKEPKNGRKSPKILLAELKINSPALLSPPLGPSSLSKPQRKEFREDNSLPSGRNTPHSSSNALAPALKPYSPQKYPSSLYEPPLDPHFKRDSPTGPLPTADRSGGDRQPQTDSRSPNVQLCSVSRTLRYE